MLNLTWMGVSWRMASSARRAGLADLDGLVPDAVSVHTCARDAWLVAGDVGPLAVALERRALRPELFVGAEAIERFLHVASGLDSAVQGEADVGRQVRAALAASRSPVAATLDHVLARLLRSGRQAGWIHEGEGVASLAARAVGSGPVSIVGAGVLGERAARLLTGAIRYNRTPRPGVCPLSALAPAPAWIVATSAPAAWFRPPEPFVTVLDLGHPAQVADDPRRVSLDALLASADARLSATHLAAAQATVRRATGDAESRLARREPLGACA